MAKVLRTPQTRTAWERMVLIHERIRSGRYPNCRQLAKEHEVCWRTIKRDLDFMRLRLHLPIEYDPQRYGFYYSKPVKEFPSLEVTEAELFALMIAHKALAQYRGTPFSAPLEAAFHKLTLYLDNTRKYSLGHLDEALSFRPFAPDDTDLKTFEVLTQALQQRRVVSFRYKKLGIKKPQRRHVHPYHLACIDNHWYLFAYDESRKALRTFVLTRMQDVRLLDRKFKQPKKFDPDEHLRGSFAVFKSEADTDFEVVVEFDAWATDLIRGRVWHPSQEVTELPGGQSRVRFRLNNIEEVERWILSFGAHAHVVRPKALADRLRKTAETLVARYAAAP